MDECKPLPGGRGQDVDGAGGVRGGGHPISGALGRRRRVGPPAALAHLHGRAVQVDRLKIRVESAHGFSA